jgi:endonuclease/exonuclease/phosphatase family metal-dependent hydrolase
MWAKFSLIALTLLMIAFAIRFDPSRSRSLLGSGSHDGPHLRLITWNIGYAELEDDSRAHTQDLKAVAETILNNDPDAVALQELTGAEQLKILLGHLHGRYRGAVAPLGNSDRVEAVLVKDREARFEQLPADGKYAIAAEFHLRPRQRWCWLVRTPTLSAAPAQGSLVVVDWARNRERGSIVLIGGDFNFELGSETNRTCTRQREDDSEAYSYALKYFRDLGRRCGYGR